MTLCLGMVLLPKPGRMDDMVAALRGHDDIEIGEPQTHGLPASAFVPVGGDEALLERLGALPPVLRVEVVFAQNVGEEQSQ